MFLADASFSLSLSLLGVLPVSFGFFAQLAAETGRVNLCWEDQTIRGWMHHALSSDHVCLLFCLKLGWSNRAARVTVPSYAP